VFKNVRVKVRLHAYKSMVSGVFLFVHFYFLVTRTEKVTRQLHYILDKSVPIYFGIHFHFLFDSLTSQLIDAFLKPQKQI